MEHHMLKIERQVQDDHRCGPGHPSGPPQKMKYSPPFLISDDSPSNRLGGEKEADNESIQKNDAQI